MIKYGLEGTELWNHRYDGPAHGDDVPSGLALGVEGNAYVTGSSLGSSGSDYATLKYAPDGHLLWLRR